MYIYGFIAGISAIWDVVRSNVHWTIGDGATVSFWSDNWIQSIGPLKNYAVQPHGAELERLTIAEMVTADGEWKWDLFQHFVTGLASP
ncbi:hypothetical protein V6N13_057276 [Hibiscus sabdariffa]